MKLSMKIFDRFGVSRLPGTTSNPVSSSRKKVPRHPSSRRHSEPASEGSRPNRPKPSPGVISSSTPLNDSSISFASTSRGPRAGSLMQYFRPLRPV